MARIRIINSADSRFIRLSLNGEEFTANAAPGGEVEVPDHFLPMLGDSHVEFELVDGPASAEDGEGAGGKIGDPPSELQGAADAEAARLLQSETKDGGRTSQDPSDIPPRHKATKVGGKPAGKAAKPKAPRKRSAKRKASEPNPI